MDTRTEGEPSPDRTPAPAGQPVYLSTRDATSEWGDDLDVIEIWNLIWRGRLFVILGTFLACVAGLVYAFVAPEWYRAEVVLIPAKDESMQSMASQFGGLASLAGIKLGADDTAEPLAVLASRDFAQDFLRDEGLVDVVLAAKRERFRGLKAGPSKEAVDIREAVEFFLKRIRGVSEDRKTGIVRLTIEWKNPYVAATWANQMAARLNQRMRQRALSEANANIAYLRSELAATNAVALQDTVGRLLEMELKKAMLAKGNREYSYRVIDPASAPRRRAWPKRSLIMVLSFALGLGLSIAALMIRNSVVVSRERAAG